MEIVAIIAAILTSLASLAAIVLSIRALNNNSRAKKSDNLIELRRLFNEEHRMNIHRALRSNEGIPDWAALDDYLGTFELCYTLIRQKNLDKEYFKLQYGYRILNLLDYDEILFYKLLVEYGSWTSFCDLVEMVYPNIQLSIYRELSKDLNEKYKDIIHQEDMNVTISRFDKADQDNLVKEINALKDRVRSTYFDKENRKKKIFRK